MPPKKVLVALPPGFLEQIDFVASVEHRNRSDLIREALRRYLESFKASQRSNLVVRNGNNIRLGELISVPVPGSRIEDHVTQGGRSGQNGSPLEAAQSELAETMDMASDAKEMVLQS